MLKPVLTTNARGKSLLKPFILIELVPSNKKCLLFLAIVNISSDYYKTYLGIGKDSPVKLDSFTITSPSIKMQSHGIFLFA